MDDEIIPPPVPHDEEKTAEDQEEESHTPPRVSDTPEMDPAEVDGEPSTVDAPTEQLAEEDNSTEVAASGPLLDGVTSADVADNETSHSKWQLVGASSAARDDVPAEGNEEEEYEEDRIVPADGRQEDPIAEESETPAHTALSEGEGVSGADPSALDGAGDDILMPVDVVGMAVSVDAVLDPALRESVQQVREQMREVNNISPEAETPVDMTAARTMDMTLFPSSPTTTGVRVVMPVIGAGPAPAMDGEGSAGPTSDRDDDRPAVSGSESGEGADGAEGSDDVDAQGFVEVERVPDNTSDIDDDEKYVQLPPGDPVVRQSEFDAFAHKTVDSVGSLQDQLTSEVTTLTEAVIVARSELRAEYRESIAEATDRVETALRADYMNHLGALREYFDGKVTEVVERGDQFVADSADALKAHFAVELQAAETRAEHARDALQEGLKVNITGIEERMAYLQQSVEVVQAALRRACDLEQLPEPRPIPDGPKVKLLVRLDVDGGATQPVPTILVPISMHASISDLKHEVLRRARRQGSLSDHTVFSTTSVIFEGVALFDDDSLADVGLEQGNVTVTLHCRHGKYSNGGRASATAGRPQHVDAASNGAEQRTPMPPPPMMPVANTNRAAAPTSAAHQHGVPPPMPNAPPRPKLSAGHDIVAGFFLNAEAAADIAEQETLERRLSHELERMEREPLKRQESLCRVRLIKDSMQRLRAQLLDKSTYSYREAHRSAARSTLARLQQVMDDPHSTVDDYARISAEVRLVVDGLGTNNGEDDRVAALEEAASRNQVKKDRLKDNLEELAYELRNKLSVPYEMMPLAERLIDDVDRVSILAASTSIDEMDALQSRIMDFMTSVRAKTRR